MRRDHTLQYTAVDDRCLVHHFIRIHGRQPTVEELLALRDRPPGMRAGAPPPQLGRSSVPIGMRREVAKFPSASDGPPRETDDGADMASGLGITLLVLGLLLLVGAVDLSA